MSRLNLKEFRVSTLSCRFFVSGKRLKGTKKIFLPFILLCLYPLQLTLLKSHPQFCVFIDKSYVCARVRSAQAFVMSLSFRLT